MNAYLPRPQARLRAVAVLVILVLAALPLASVEAAATQSSYGSATDRAAYEDNTETSTPRFLQTTRTWLQLIVELFEHIFRGAGREETKPTRPVNPLEVDTGRGSMLDPSG